MDNLYILMKDAQNNIEESVTDIFDIFKPKIKKSLNQTKLNNRGDLEQEIYIAIFKIIQNYDLDSTPNYFESRDYM